MAGAWARGNMVRDCMGQACMEVVHLVGGVSVVDHSNSRFYSVHSKVFEQGKDVIMFTFYFIF